MRNKRIKSPSLNQSSMQLTKKLIENTLPPDTGQIFLRDDDVSGLAVRVTAGGAKTWVLEMRVGGRPKRMTLGRWGDYDVAAARVLAHEWRGAIGRGEDPTAGRNGKACATRAHLQPLPSGSSRSTRSGERDHGRVTQPAFAICSCAGIAGISRKSSARM